jgi:hypothetical protein
MPFPKHPLPDSVYASSIRELKWILAIWTASFIWVVGYCVLYGYYEEEAPLVTVMGMPSWVFWGVFLPWFASLAATAWFALSYMEDHDLNPEPKAPPEAKEAVVSTPTAHDSDSSKPVSEKSDG